MGGLPARNVEPTEHDYEEWERRVDALMVLCVGLTGKKRLMTVDELRKNIESLPPRPTTAPPTTRSGLLR